MAMPAPARLAVLRHAKSARPEDVPDHARPLARRGRRDAPAAGRWLHAAGCVPDLVICSTASRTRETWDLVEPELGTRPTVVLDPRVYEATATGLLDVLHEVPEERRTVLLIGHQPGVQDLVLSLAGDGGDDHALARAEEKFPTSAVAVLLLRGPWAELAAGSTALTDFAVPRGSSRRAAGH